MDNYTDVEEESLQQFTKFVQDRIIQLCEERGISSLQLSYGLGQGKSFIHDIITGRHLPLLANLHNICEYFGITEAEFFDPKLSSPSLDKEIRQEINRICNNDAHEIGKFLNVLKAMTPESAAALQQFLAAYSKNNYKK